MIDVYVGGLFEYAGNGVQVTNIAKYSSGSWTPVSTNWTAGARIITVTSYGTSLFCAPSAYTEAGDPLPFDVIDTNTGNSILSSMFTYIPTCPTYQFVGVNTFYVDDSYVYVAGRFQVMLSSGALVTNRLFHSLFHTFKQMLIYK